MPTHIASLGRLDGFNLPSNNVNTMSLARTYRGIPRDWGAIPPSPVGPEMSQYEPPAFGRRFVLQFQGLRVLGGIAPPISRTVFLDTSLPDSWYSINTVKILLFKEAYCTRAYRTPLSIRNFKDDTFMLNRVPFFIRKMTFLRGEMGKI